MRNLVVHIGTHKTGTTTIQHALDVADRQGGPKSWSYLRLPQEPLVRLMLAERSSNSLNELIGATISEAVEAKALPDSQTQLVISFEGLSGNPLLGYRNTSIISEALLHATKQFRTRLVVYLRRQDLWLESMYTQKIHEGESYDFEEFLQLYEDSDSLDYHQLITAFEAVFGSKSVSVRSYHQANQNGLVKDFADATGLTRLTPVESAGRMNRSYSPLAVEVARIANQKLDSVQRKKLRSVLQASMAKSPSESFAYFSPSQRRSILTRFEESNHKLARDFGFSTSSLFPELDSDLVARRNSLHTASPEQVADLAVEMLKQFAANSPQDSERKVARQSLWKRLLNKGSHSL